MFLIVSLAVRVKKRGAILWIISAGTSNWSLVATFNAESICAKPVSSTSFRCSLHSLLNILSLKFYICGLPTTRSSKCPLLTIVPFDALKQASVTLYGWLKWLKAIVPNLFRGTHIILYVGGYGSCLLIFICTRASECITYLIRIKLGVVGLFHYPKFFHWETSGRIDSESRSCELAVLLYFNW